ncbi:hypothetical protein FI667_g11012, partial [Globisporangium splendens]
MEEQQDIVRLVEEFQADDAAFRTVLEARQAKELRSACVRLGIRVQGKAMTESMLNNKAGYIDLICKHRRGLDANSGYTPPPVHSRSTRHCIFRLLNVLFSDAFAERLHEADGAPARAAASDAETDHDKGEFWVDVEKAYTSRDPSFDSLITWRPSYAPIQPSKAASHSASKLKEMWKQHVTRYSIALARFRQSGAHESNFFSFCAGRYDVLYLHDWLQVRPDLVALVPAPPRWHGEHLPQLRGILPRPARVDTQEDDDTGSSERLPHLHRRRPRSSRVDALEDDGSSFSDRDATPGKKRRRATDRILAAPAGEDQETPSIRTSRVIRDTVGTLEVLKNGGFWGPTLEAAKGEVSKLAEKWLKQLQQETNDM